ncbi:pyrroline-5-carboxylate reductase [Spirochaetota bacterium]
MGTVNGKQPHIGIIGAGNMGSAICRGLLRKKAFPPSHIHIFDAFKNKTAIIKKSSGVNIEASIPSIAEKSDIIIIAVKPDIVGTVCMELKSPNIKKKLIISIAAGKKIDTIKRFLGKEKIKIARVMPNTPAQVSQGASAISCNKAVNTADRKVIEKIFSSLGKAVFVDEKLMDAVTGLSGSGPAYVFMFIDALADGGVKNGLPRDVALTLAAQTVLGAASMLLSTGKHPSVLKDMVCSPGGTTIAAVEALEKSSFRHAIINAISRATERSKELGVK